MSNANDLIVEFNEITNMGVLDLRLLPENKQGFKAVENILGFALPTTPRTSQHKDRITALWFSIDQWLITMDQQKIDEVKSKLDEALSGQFYSLVDVSSLRSILSIKGDKARQVLAKSCSTNLYIDDYKSGFVRRIAIADQGAALHVVSTEPEEIHIYIFRSYFSYVEKWLKEAAHKDRALAVTLG